MRSFVDPYGSLGEHAKKLSAIVAGLAALGLTAGTACLLVPARFSQFAFDVPVFSAVLLVRLADLHLRTSGVRDARWDCLRLMLFPSLLGVGLAISLLDEKLHLEPRHFAWTSPAVWQVAFARDLVLTGAVIVLAVAVSLVGQIRFVSRTLASGVAG